MDPLGGRDHLGIDQDARALAALTASASMQPPLAIGVYGEWGSGKTFFMHRIEHWIPKIQAVNGKAAAFERGIAEVWFNAWHYSAADSDTSLWASLVTHIFASLNADDKGIDKTVLEQVNAARRISDELEQRLHEARDAKNKADELVEKAQQDFSEAVAKAAEAKASDVYAAITSDEMKPWQDQMRKAADAAGLTQDAKGARDLAGQAQQLIALGSSVTALATAGKWWKSPLALALYAAVIVAGGAYAVRLLAGWHEFSATAAQFAALCTAAAAWIGRSSALIRHIVKPAEAVQQKINDRVEAERRAQLRLVTEAEGRQQAAAVQVEALSNQHARAMAAVTAAEAEYGSLTGPELLRRYIAERAGSRDYDRYLGVVALAQNDLEQLSRYLTRANKQATDSDISRIVLYIDDLDRCTPTVVANVLAAVHLLLSLPLFTVIVGVDPRWLHSALAQAHTDLFPEGEKSPPSATTNDYLEKIFQLTYTLPAMTAEGCAALVTATIDDVFSPPTATSSTRDAQTESAEAIQTVKALRLTDADKAGIRQMAPFVARTPRGTKRFLSMYLLIRARALAEPRFTTDRVGAKSNALLLLVALMLKVPGVVAHLPATPDRTITFGKWLEGRGGGLDRAPGLDFPLAESEKAQLLRLRETAPTFLDAQLRDVVAWRTLAQPYTNYTNS